MKALGLAAVAGSIIASTIAASAQSVYYDQGPRQYRERYERPNYGGDYYRRSERRNYNPNYGRPTYDRRGTISCNVPGYTFQNGACRPYTGR